MRALTGLAVLATLLLPAGCAGSSETREAKQPERAAQPRARFAVDRAPIALKDLRFVGMDDGPVPEFHLRTVDGQALESSKLVGDRAFVFVFFATWCQVCDMKLPLLRRALQAEGPVTAIGVAVDDAETWARVQPYLRKHGVANWPIVRAQSYPAFAVSYNPFSTVPLVVVVGQNGGLVDYQVGYAPEDQERLQAAVRLAKEIGPLKSAP